MKIKRLDPWYVATSGGQVTRFWSRKDATSCVKKRIEEDQSLLWIMVTDRHSRPVAYWGWNEKRQKLIRRKPGNYAMSL